MNKLSVSVEKAYLHLQNKLFKTKDVWVQEKIERAMDELLRHPDRVGDPKNIVNNALGNAGKVLRDRSKRQVKFEADLTEVLETTNLSTDYEGTAYLKFEVADMMDRSSMNHSYISVIMDIINEQEVQVSPVKKSRARTQFRKIWTRYVS